MWRDSFIDYKSCVWHTKHCTWHRAVIIITWHTVCYLHVLSHLILTTHSQKDGYYFPWEAPPFAPGHKAVRCQVRICLLHLKPVFSAFPGWLAAAPCFRGHPMVDLSIRTEGDFLWIIKFKKRTNSATSLAHGDVMKTAIWIRKGNIIYPFSF